MIIITRQLVDCFKQGNGIKVIQCHTALRLDVPAHPLDGLTEKRLTCLRHGVEDNHALRGDPLRDSLHDLDQLAPMPADKDGIGSGQSREVCLQEISYVGIETGCGKPTDFLQHQLATSLPYLKRLDMQMGELGLCLDGDGTGTETDVPEMASLPQVE